MKIPNKCQCRINADTLWVFACRQSTTEGDKHPGVRLGKMASSSPDAGTNPSSDTDEKGNSETDYSPEEGVYEVHKIVGISKQDVSKFQ